MTNHSSITVSVPDDPMAQVAADADEFRLRAVLANHGFVHHAVECENQPMTGLRAPILAAVPPARRAEAAMMRVAIGRGGVGRMVLVG